MLDEIDKKSYVVGGRCRDIMLMHLGMYDPEYITSNDIDYVVVGSSEQEMLNAGFKRVGNSFPVFLHPETGYEYSLARTERKTGIGYGGFVVETKGVTLEQDLQRRDFSINSMAWSASEHKPELIDPNCGLEDLKNGIIRHLSDAFKDDPLRALRAARFAARYGFKIHESTLEEIKKIPKTDREALKPERVVLEFKKAIADGKLNMFIWWLDSIGFSEDIENILGINLLIKSNFVETKDIKTEFTKLLLNDFEKNGIYGNNVICQELQQYAKVAIMCYNINILINEKHYDK